LSGQLAGAGATRFLAAFGAQVIRVEDPVRKGAWDILRGGRPNVDERRGLELGGAFNNHNVGKLGVTINLRSPEGRDLFSRLVAASDVVTENFAAGVLSGLGFPYDRLREINPSVIYVSNSGFGHTGPYAQYKTWGPIVQALSGLTFTSGLAGHPPAGWGFSYMDHMGANFMALAVLAALVHRNRTGEGQWVDLAMTEVGLTLIGPALLDATVHDRPMRRAGVPDSSHSDSPAMAPHGVYPALGDDCWVAIACRDDADWLALAAVVGEQWAWDARFDSLAGRRSFEADLDRQLAAWSSTCDRFELATRLRRAGIPAEAVQRPSERIDNDGETAAWGLWPTVSHPQMGNVRVDGLPLHLSLTDWHMKTGAPMLGEHNRDVFCGLLGIDEAELDELHAAGAV
jgi:crotonobetainyl-CoA:carnitine CoA-transferase CaiB-like acyl-CoA transferase